MIVVADSGATKTDWRIIMEDFSSASFETVGLSPYFNTELDFNDALTHGFPKELNPNEVSKVFFYGAGCGTQERGSRVESYLHSFFPAAEIFAWSDALGAAHALLHNDQGIIVILGTGSNISYYDGAKLEAKTPSLGFILGDEGSGANMGRLLLRDFFYGRMDSVLGKRLSSIYDMDLAHVLNMIYDSPKPSAYLASFVPFLLNNVENPYISDLITRSFEEMYQLHLSCYPNIRSIKIGVTGSVGCLFSSILDGVASQHGFKVYKYVRYPISSLVDYHVNLYHSGR